MKVQFTPIESGSNLAEVLSTHIEKRQNEQVIAIIRSFAHYANTIKDVKRYTNIYRQDCLQVTTATHKFNAAISDICQALNTRVLPGIKAQVLANMKQFKMPKSKKQLPLFRVGAIYNLLWR